MTSTAAVSVILPTFNRVAELGRSVGSVLHQSFRDLELIVVDDGSSEDVRSRLEAFGDDRIRYVRQETRLGVAAARNAGVALARGRYVAFQDSDDEWLLDKLQRQLDLALQAPSGAELVVCGLWRIRGRSVSRYPDRVRSDDVITHAEVLCWPFAYCQTWLVRRDLLVAEGGFDESMHNWSDWEMLIRLSRRVPVALLPQPLVVAPQSPDSLTVVKPQWLTAMRHIRQKHRALLSRLPEADAAMRYAHARLYLAAGDACSARRELLWNLPRLHWRSAALLALSVGGRRVLSRALGQPIPAQNTP